MRHAILSVSNIVGRGGRRFDMSLLSKLNAKYGRHGVPNVTVIFIVGQIFLYLAIQLNPGEKALNIVERIQLVPAKVLSGEVWRLGTFLFMPPTMNVLFAAMFWYLFYLMGTALEQTWGAFRYNVFLAVGYIASVAAAFAAPLAAGPVAAHVPATNAFLYGTVFLAFARLYPEFTLLLFFVLPVQIRWLALIQWIIYGWTFLVGDWMARGMIVAAVANYLLFFGRDIWFDVKHGHRRMRFQAKAVKGPPRIVHKCRVCGITNEQAPRMQFRYCSKCDGECCYCAEHAANHEHVVRQVEGASS